VQEANKALSFPAHTADASKVLDALGVDPTHGLSASEVQTRLATYGPNRIKPPPKASLGKIIFRQVANAMTVILSESRNDEVSGRLLT
jgi:magnesium-transporting ATPase (P-type)